MQVLQRDSTAATLLDLLSGVKRAGDFDRLNTPEKRGLARQLARVTRWDLGGEITGFGYGRKWVNGFPTEDPCIRIYVQNKKPKSALWKGSMIPAEIRLEGFDQPVLLDVIAQDHPEATTLRREQRPLFPGLSIGHCGTGHTGTIGAFFRDTSQPQIKLLLSASHVIAVSGLAARRDAIIQPGHDHGGGCPSSTVANLEAAARLTRNGPFPNRIDAALAILKGNIGTRDAPAAPSGIASKADVSEGDMVQSLGCESGMRTGQIIDLNFRCHIRHRFRFGPVYFGFRETILTSIFSQPGDSGGPFLTQNNQLLGIHMAGSRGNSVASPIWSILNHWPQLQLLEE